MHPCHACRRHVRADASTCPFCAAVLRHDGAPLPRLAGVLLGLTMMSCSGDDATDEGATITTTMTSAPTTTDASTGTGTSTTNDDNGVSVAAYGDPSFDDSSGRIDSSSSDTSGGSETSGSDSSSSSGSSGTDTGASSSDTGSAESADYGAAAPRNQ